MPAHARARTAKPGACLLPEGGEGGGARVRTGLEYAPEFAPEAELGEIDVPDPQHLPGRQSIPGRHTRAEHACRTRSRTVGGNPPGDNARGCLSSFSAPVELKIIEKTRGVERKPCEYTDKMACMCSPKCRAWASVDGCKGASFRAQCV